MGNLWLAAMFVEMGRVKYLKCNDDAIQSNDEGKTSVGVMIVHSREN